MTGIVLSGATGLTKITDACRVMMDASAGVLIAFGGNMNRRVVCMLLLSSSVASGQGMAKWVDEQGRVHYGDQPPANAKELAITKGTISTVGSQLSTSQSLGEQATETATSSLSLKEQEAAFQARRAARVQRDQQDQMMRNQREATGNAQQAIRDQAIRDEQNAMREKQQALRPEYEEMLYRQQLMQHNEQLRRYRERSPPGR